MLLRAGLGRLRLGALVEAERRALEHDDARGDLGEAHERGIQTIAPADRCRVVIRHRVERALNAPREFFGDAPEPRDIAPMRADHAHRAFGRGLDRLMRIVDVGRGIEACRDLAAHRGREITRPALSLRVLRNSRASHTIEPPDFRNRQLPGAVFAFDLRPIDGHGAIRRHGGGCD